MSPFAKEQVVAAPTYITSHAARAFLANPDVFAPDTGTIISFDNITDPARQQATTMILKRKTETASE